MLKQTCVAFTCVVLSHESMLIWTRLRSQKYISSLHIDTLSFWWFLCSAAFTSILSVGVNCALERNRCDWSHPVIDEPIRRLSDPADCFIIDVIVPYIRAGSSPVRLEDILHRFPSLWLWGSQLDHWNMFPSQTPLERLEKWQHDDIMSSVFGQFYCFAARLKCVLRIETCSSEYILCTVACWFQGLLQTRLPWHWLLWRKDELIDMSAAGGMNIWRALTENNEVFFI